MKYRKIIDSFMCGWYRIFSEEYTSKGNATGETVGKPFSVRKSDGTIITVQNRADGQVEIKNSNKPNTMVILTAEMFCRYLGC